VASVLSDINDLATWPPFLRRVTAAAIHAAVDVGAEAFDGTQYRIARRALALNVFGDTDIWGARFAWGVAANPVITAESSDGDIQFTVNSLWDALAGAMQQP
jgi:hypothetical protein